MTDLLRREITPSEPRVASQSNAVQPPYRVIRELAPTVFVCAGDGDIVVVKILSFPQRVDRSVDGDSYLLSKLLSTTGAHPGIVTCLDFREYATPAQPNSALLIMEYCSTDDLFSVLEEQPGNCLREPQALRYFRQIVAGVHHLHGLGFAHRDISLENVLLDADGDAKLCDFALSSSARERCVGIVGKAQYMAPEVAVRMAYNGVTADVWSLGVVLVVMLTGSPLFTLAVPTDPMWVALQRVGVGGIVRHWRMEQRISASTVDLLGNMLHIDAAQRPQSLDVVLRLLPQS